jgi:hypothetical protein
MQNIKANFTSIGKNSFIESNASIRGINGNAHIIHNQVISILSHLY